MNHYAYLLEFDNGMKYYGARSTHLEPELDASYLGSGRALPKDRYGNKPKKTIVQTFSTREELMKHEHEFLVQYSCCTDPLWYNQRLTSTDRHGQGSPWNVGKQNDRTKFAETYSRRYKNNRSPAMLAAHARTAEKIRGVKNLSKGHKGTSNCAFKPWYYCTPEGECIEVYDTTIRDMAAKIGWSERQIRNRMSSINAHNPAKTLPMKGWIFGHLPKAATVSE